MKAELGEQLERLQEVIVALEREESHLNVTAVKLIGEVVAMHKTVTGLREDVQSVTDRLPHPNRGPPSEGARRPQRRSRQGWQEGTETPLGPAINSLLATWRQLPDGGSISLEWPSGRVI
ncbi:MAG: hypothetical protein LC790_01580 [Actinobacteria bacterium]|nr:hypothetical protein [Actinomycetota bacterium]